jgi:hypothetical protein
MLALSGGIILATAGFLVYWFRPLESRKQRPDWINTTGAILITASLLLGVSLLMASLMGSASG